MTNLSDFLKVKKVRCIDNDVVNHLTIGKVYKVMGVEGDGTVKVFADNGFAQWYLMDRFEPVLDPAENPLQGVELTPEFEAVEPVLADNSVNLQDIGTDILDTNADIKDTAKFKVGDRVYCRIHEPKIFTILGVGSDNTAHFGESDKYGYEWWSFKNLCHATTENYERLQATFTDIKFERPSLTGSDLCRAIKAKGKKFIICAVSDISEEDAINNYLNGDEEMDVIFEIDDELDHPFIAIWGNLYKFAVPLSEETGEPLTESILND